MRSLSAMLLFLVAACASAGGATSRPTTAPICGWTESAKTCAADADCAEDSACVEGLGKEIVPETKDGLEAMPPYDRVHVRFCQSRACPKDASGDPPK